MTTFDSIRDKGCIWERRNQVVQLHGTLNVCTRNVTVARRLKKNTTMNFRNLNENLHISGNIEIHKKTVQILEMPRLGLFFDN